MRHERLRVHFDKPSNSPSLSRPVILYYIKLIICAARLYILFYQVALDRPAIRSVFFNARYQRGKIGLRPGKKSPVLRLVCAAPLDLTKTRSARGNTYEIIRNEKFHYFATAPLRDNRDQSVIYYMLYLIEGITSYSSFTILLEIFLKGFESNLVFSIIPSL